MGRVKRHNECGLVVGQLFENAGLRDDAGWAQSLKISN
jgi:hypothetical protein